MKKLVPKFVRNAVNKLVGETTRIVKQANNELNPYKKTRDKKDAAIKNNVADLTRQFEEQKANLKKEVDSLRSKLNTSKDAIPEQSRQEISKQIATLESEIVHLNLFDKALLECIDPTEGTNNLAALKACLDAGEQDLIDAFMSFNPLGIAMLFDSKDAVDYLYTHFAKFIKPDAKSIIGLTLTDCLAYAKSPDYIHKVINLNARQKRANEHKRIAKIIDKLDKTTDDVVQRLDQYLRIKRDEPLPTAPALTQEIYDNNSPDVTGRGHAAYLAAEVGDLQTVKRCIEEDKVYQIIHYR